MKLLFPILLVSANCWTYAFKMEDVALYLPLLRSVRPRPCPPNEMWQPCVANCSDCERRGSCHVTPDCQPGCDCLPRYFRVEPGGPCLPVAKCPRPECGPNEVFRECGPSCERCGTPRCRMISCDHRCYCKEGHLRDADGKCVPQEECPKRSSCSHNEEWSESGRVDEYCWPDASSRTQEVPGCYCKEGHSRSAFGSCMKTETCSIKCFGDATYHECVPGCNATCRSDPGCKEDGNCYPGCFCNATTHRMDDFNRCIEIKQCTEDPPDAKVVAGPGIMVDESGASETTPAGPEGTTAGHEETPEADSEEGTGLHTEDVGRAKVSSADARTHATTEPEDFANEDI